MLHKNRLFTPGPTPLLPAAQTAMASFTAHHRTADFRALFQRVLADMKEFIGTKNDVLVLACSGTGVMEASVSNLTSPGDKVLVLTAGKFGERWTGLAKAFGCNVDVLSVPYGETFSLDEIRARVTSDLRAVFVQATESSTGARHDMTASQKSCAAQGEGTLLVVDAITGLGTTHLNVDGWGVDVIIGGSQKALMMPPGWPTVRSVSAPGSGWMQRLRRAITLICAKSASRRRRESRHTRRRHLCLQRSGQR